MKSKRISRRHMCYVGIAINMIYFGLITYCEFFANVMHHSEQSFYKRLQKFVTETSVEFETNQIGNKAARTVINILDYGAIGDNKTDCTMAIRSAIEAVHAKGGGEVLIPMGGVFKTGPFNLTSNLVFRVEGTLFGISDQYAFPAVPALPSYGRCADMKGKFRRHPFVNAYHENNITIRGHGTIDGGGWYWYPFFFNFTAAHNIGRPHLMELNNCTNIEITEVTLKDSAFWTLHPVYSRDLYIHHIKILAPSCRNYRCANTDGIDIDSCENVLVEYNQIDVGDDHVTVLAGKLRKGRAPPCRNVTVQHNTLLRGMGLSIGSSTAGGISDVLYYNNTMTQEIKTQMGQGIHIKLRDRFGGYVRNVAWIDNVFHVAGKPGGAIVFECGYQPGQWKPCTSETCPEVRDIVVRNLIVEIANPGTIACYAQRPCVNITFENVHFQDSNARIQCDNVLSGSLVNNSPPELFDACVPNLTKSNHAIWK